MSAALEPSLAANLEAFAQFCTELRGSLRCRS